MIIENQVCSLESAQKLKELGIKQESLFYWDGNTRVDGGFDLHQRTLTQFNKDKMISAFTVAELGEMLPQIEYQNKKCAIVSYQFAGNDGYCCDIITLELEDNLYEIVSQTEADARAKMLVYLLENKLVPLPSF